MFLHCLVDRSKNRSVFEEGRCIQFVSVLQSKASVTIDDVVYVIDSGVRKERWESF